MSASAKNNKIRAVITSVNNRAKSLYDKTIAVGKNVKNKAKLTHQHTYATFGKVIDRATIAYQASRSISSILNDRAKFAFYKSQAVSKVFNDRAKFVYFTSRAVLSYEVEAFFKALFFSQEVDDTSQAFDVHKIDFTKNVIDAADAQTLIVDDQQIQFFKVVTDTVRVNESFASTKFSFNDEEDSSSIVDITQFDITKFITDSVIASDSLRVGIPPQANSDTTGLTDNSVFGIGKSLLDTFPIAESIAITYTKQPTDIPRIADTPTLAFSKVLADGGISSDVLVKLTSKKVSDSASIGDFGVITIQNYCDPSYFAQDYVGDSRAFT